MKKCKDGHHID